VHCSVTSNLLTRSIREPEPQSRLVISGDTVRIVQWPPGALVIGWGPAVRAGTEPSPLQVSTAGYPILYTHRQFASSRARCQSRASNPVPPCSHIWRRSPAFSCSSLGTCKELNARRTSEDLSTSIPQPPGCRQLWVSSRVLLGNESCRRPVRDLVTQASRFACEATRYGVYATYAELSVSDERLPAHAQGRGNPPSRAHPPIPFK